MPTFITLWTPLLLSPSRSSHVFPRPVRSPPACSCTGSIPYLPAPAALLPLLLLSLLQLSRCLRCHNHPTKEGIIYARETQKYERCRHHMLWNPFRPIGLQEVHVISKHFSYNYLSYHRVEWQALPVKAVVVGHGPQSMMGLSIDSSSFAMNLRTVLISKSKKIINYKSWK